MRAARDVVWPSDCRVALTAVPEAEQPALHPSAHDQRQYSFRYRPFIRYSMLWYFAGMKGGPDPTCSCEGAMRTSVLSSGGASRPRENGLGTTPHKGSVHYRNEDGLR